MKLLLFFFSPFVLAVSAPLSPIQSSDVTMIITSATGYRPFMANPVLSPKFNKNPTDRVRRIFDNASVAKFIVESEKGDPRFFKFDLEAAEKELPHAFLPFRPDKKAKGKDKKWKANPVELIQKLRKWGIPMVENGSFSSVLDGLTSDYFDSYRWHANQRWYWSPIGETSHWSEDKKKDREEVPVLHSVLVEWGERKMEDLVEKLSPETWKKKNNELTEEEIYKKISSEIYKRHFDIYPIKLIKYKYNGNKPKEAEQKPQVLEGLYVITHKGLSDRPFTARSGYLAYPTKDNEGPLTYLIELEKVVTSQFHLKLELYGNCFAPTLVAPFVGKTDLTCRECNACELVNTDSRAGSYSYLYQFLIAIDEDHDKYPQYFSMFQSSTFISYVLSIAFDKETVEVPFHSDRIYVLRPGKTKTGAPICVKREIGNVPMFDFQG